MNWWGSSIIIRPSSTFISEAVAFVVTKLHLRADCIRSNIQIGAKGEASEGELSMDTLSVMGAAISLECAVLLIGLVVLLDLKRLMTRREKLINSLKATLDGVETAIPHASQPRAA
jgi:hypothetical protein